MQRLVIPSSLAAAMVISFLLFAFMAKLISKPGETNYKPVDYRADIFTDAKQDNKPEDKKIRKIRDLTKPTPPPEQQKFLEINQPDNSTSSTLAGFEGVKLNVHSEGLPGGMGGVENVFSLGSNNVDRDAMPISQVEPQYPIDAQRKGIEGWVRLNFDIDQSGSVVNISVVDSNPKRVFDKAARRALKRWRYKAKYIGGEPVIQQGINVQLDFSLDGR